MNDELLKLITSFIVRFVLKNFQNLLNFGNFLGLHPQTPSLQGHHNNLVSRERRHGSARKIIQHIISACLNKIIFSRHANCISIWYVLIYKFVSANKVQW
jgi:hypothetical protein